MESLLSFVTPPGQCGYLPTEEWSLEYNLVQSMTPEEYGHLMANGWRRFRRAVFRPRCQSCKACRPIRVVVDRFHHDRSQRRVRRDNETAVELRIQRPSVSKAKLDLYDEYHTFQANAKGWPQNPPKDPDNYSQSFVDNPFPVEEWCYYIDSCLVGVGYVDCVPGAMSGIYFYYDPGQRQRSLGTWNVLSMVAAAARRRVPHLYLGYYVADCPSMQYKAQFRPCEIRDDNGNWRIFRE